MRSAATIVVVVAAAAAISSAQAPPSYYSTVNATSAALLRSTLHAVIDDHTRVPYTSGGTDTWDVLEVADEAPSSSTQIIDLYKNALYTKQGGGNTFYNREHVWPNSYGFPVDGGTNYPYTDCHHLFLCDISYNGARDNNPFQTAVASWTEWPTVLNGGQGGGSGTFPGNSNWWTAAGPDGGWQTWNGRRGDVARAIFYMDVRYEGGTHGGSGAAEPDLRLTDDLNLIHASATGANTSIAYMGQLTTLLQWHLADPVDAKEMAHNNAVYAVQGNRNPFVDHPEWVACIYQNNCVRVRLPEIWINEVHYDNTGSDVGEFVEIAGPAGDRLTNWALIAYDGATGIPYARLRLSGAFPNQQNGFGTLSFPFAGLQDGAPDGLALVAANGVVVQFLAYEGSFAAASGAARTRTAADIGVAESASTPVGQSLQLSGTGSNYTQFVWQSAQTATPGARNTGQTFQ